MTPVLFAWYIAFGVVGLYSPLLMVWLIKSFLKSINAFCSQLKTEREYRRLMKPEYWHFVSAVQAPNNQYISIKFMHSETHKTVSIGVEKKHIRELM